MDKRGGAEQRFGAFSYDSSQRLLFRDGEPVPLVPKLADTLHVLLERRGRLVEKAELIRLVWPDATVEESGLARNISLLRKALGDESEEFIQTVPKRGYRFAAELDPPSLTKNRRFPRRRWLVVGLAFAVVACVLYWQFFLPGRLMRNTGSGADIAVLPFEPIPPANAVLSHAFDETLVAALAQVQTARVLSPSTVARYRSAKVPAHIMARLLGMDAVLEGTVQMEAGHVRVTARLADVHSGKIIWAKRYDRAATQEEPAQAWLARTIAADIAPHLAIQGAFQQIRTNR